MMRKMIPWVCLTLMLCILCTAQADPILLAPSGTTLSTGQIHAEAAFGLNDEHSDCYWLGAGLGQYEVNLLRVEVGGENQNRIGVQWNFLPETLLTPAVSFGVTDAASESDEGIGIYAAVTREIPVGGAWPLISSLRATAGIGAFGIKGPFAGLEAGLPGGLFVQAEYDSEEISAAVGWQAMRYLRLKAYRLRGESYLGAELVPLEF